MTTSSGSVNDRRSPAGSAPGVTVPAASSPGRGTAPDARGRRPVETVDAVVVGAGHHGLVAATVLADAGWDVLVLESRDVVGGAVATREIHADGDTWLMDEFSSCHPLAVASPVLRGLDLQDHGLEWAETDRVVAHVGQPDDTRGALMLRDSDATAERLAQECPRDGRVWRELVAHYRSIKEPLLEALLTAWPPVAATGKLVAAAGPATLPDLARFLLLPSGRMGEELFSGAEGRHLIAGNAMHADIPPDAPLSGVFGWLMTMLAQDSGFPSPKGGTRELARALASRAEEAGARIETGVPVERIVVHGGRAYGVQTADGRRIRARRAVIADTSAPALYERLLDRDAVPAGLRARLDRFAWDLPTLKLNYRLSGPMPWTAEGARRAGVVHVGQDSAGLVQWSADLSAGRVPERPFALVGQMTSIDATRSPAGTEALWLYTHLPRGVHDDATAEQTLQASERMFDDFAPGWRDLVLDRWDQRPSDLRQSNDNLGQGAVGGGTMQLFQQAIWRPVTGLGGPRTHVPGLYLGSAAVHPGGGVHGGAGFLAARAALADRSWWGRPLRRVSLAALHRLYDGTDTLPPGYDVPR